MVSWVCAWHARRDFRACPGLCCGGTKHSLSALSPVSQLSHPGHGRKLYLETTRRSTLPDSTCWRFSLSSGFYFETLYSRPKSILGLQLKGRNMGACCSTCSFKTPSSSLSTCLSLRKTYSSILERRTEMRSEFPFQASLTPVMPKAVVSNGKT